MGNAASLAGSVSVAYLQGLVEHLGQCGVTPQALLGHVQLTPAILAQRDQRIAASAYLELLGRAERLSGDPHLGLPLGQADAQVRRLFDAYAERLLAELRRGNSVLDRARELLAAQLAAGAPDLEHLATALALSPRTLQRRLRESGLSFSQLVDETRQQLVMHYLRDPALELADIAFLVGFSESGSLGRAFRRWTGQSLGEYRRTPHSKP